MPWIYHEKQDAALCGVHCLNNLLQGAFYSEIDLARIAHDLDDNERSLMAEMGTDTKEFLKFMQEDSGNVADDGNYSVQVLSHALESVWGVTLSSITHEDNSSILANPLGQQGFVCNLQNHWFAIRKIDGKWFNLNSLNDKPEFLGDIYLSAFLKQLEIEGYSIFIVKGTLPAPQKDSTSGIPYDKMNWMLINEKPAQVQNQKFGGEGHRLGGAPAPADEDELQRAIRLSMQGSGQVPSAVGSHVEMTEEQMLEIAIQESLRQSASPSEEPKASIVEPEPNSDVDPSLITKLVIRLPDGSRVERRFLRETVLKQVFNWLDSLGHAMSKHSLSSSFPKKEFTELDQSLSALGLAPSALLSLMKK